MISKNKKIIFVHIPKTGGSSIEKCLHGVFDETIVINGDDSIVKGNIKNLYENSYNSFKHSTIMELKNHYKDENFNEFHKFAVIRNPWDRLLSLYRWTSKGETRYDKKQFLNYFNGVKEIDEYNKRALWTINRYVCNEKDDIMVDTLLDFENLNNDFVELNSKLGLTNNSLPHINRTNTKNFREVMDEEVIQIIKHYYKKEIDKFWSNNEIY
tara:strand:+ start:480 stop:1115 length:636 start_codon:yes stop_codon:yes gene_type:complete